MTSYIEHHEATKFKAGMLKSKEMGFPVNTFVTILLEQAGYQDEGAILKWANIRKSLSQYHAANNCPWVCLWVLENSSFNGTHVHAVLHRNTQLIANFNAYKKKLVTCLGEVHNTLVKVQPFSHQKEWNENVTDLTDYCLKGIRSCHSDLIGREAVFQGQIMGRRIGWSRNLMKF